MSSFPSQIPSPQSLRRLYLDWVEEQIEEYKDSIPRSELLCLADQVVADLRVNRKGQYQLTELLLMEAVNRKIFRILRLPSYRSWSAAVLARLQVHTQAPPPVKEPPAPELTAEEPPKVRLPPVATILAMVPAEQEADTVSV